MWKDPFPAADLHSYSQVFHAWTSEQCRFLTAKSFAALPSGGRLVVHELLLNADKSGPRLPTLMGMVMLLCRASSLDQAITGRMTCKYQGMHQGR